MIRHNFSSFRQKGKETTSSVTTRQQTTNNLHENNNITNIHSSECRNLQLKNNSDNYDKISDRSSLYNKNRCYLEDFMSLEVNDNIVLLLPTSNTHRKYDRCIDRLRPPVVCFGDGSSNSVNSMYYIFENCTITTTPYKDRVENGISVSELSDGLGTHNFGLTITIDSSTNDNISDKYCESFTILVTWSEVLLGRRFGMQVWASLNPLREVKKILLNYRRDETKLLSLLAYLYEEVFGDSLQMMMLVS